MGPRPALLFVLVSMLSATSVRAQGGADSADSAVARSLFREAVELAEQERWPEAVERYRRVIALRASPVVRFNLAHALVQVGGLVEASELLEGLRRDEEAPAAIRGDAERLLEDVRPRLATLTIRLEGDPTGAEVRIGARVVAEAAIGVPMPADPGSYDVLAVRGEEEVARGSVELEPGGAGEVRLRVPPPPAPPPPPPEEVARREVEREADPPAPPPPGENIAENGWFWLGILTGVAAAVAVPILVVLLTEGGGGQGIVNGDLMPGRLEIGP